MTVSIAFPRDPKREKSFACDIPILYLLRDTLNYRPLSSQLFYELTWMVILIKKGRRLNKNNFGDNP